MPVENVLGEIGKGHLIAFNALNIGRLKLCAAALGGSKRAITISTQYAKAREQFGISISRFGAIKHKLAQMAIRIWVCEKNATITLLVRRGESQTFITIKGTGDK